MGRLKELKKYVNKKLSEMKDPDDMLKAAGHLYGVSMSAELIAQKRGLDTELAGMAGMLHDLYAYESGSYDDHAHKGADLARKVLVAARRKAATECSPSLKKKMPPNPLNTRMLPKKRPQGRNRSGITYQ